MKRSEFIKNGLTLGVGLPFLSLFLESCDKKDISNPNFDVNFNGKVLIVGAGAAGLTAGYLLNRHNVDFQIIEASSDFGGRVKRVEGFADFPIDLGAEWIHDEPSVLARLISDPSIDAEIDIINYNPQTIYNWKNDKLKKQNWASNFYSEYKFKSTTWYGFFENYIVPGISDKIVYDAPVNEIDYSGEKIVVKTSDNQIFEADKILVTVPTKILQSDIISFIPNLPTEKTNAINGIEVPDGIKVFIEFSENFYPDILMLGGLVNNLRESGEKIYYDAAFRKDSQRNIMGLFSVGEKASAFTELNDSDEIIAKILAELDEIFDGKASQTYVKHIVQNWSKEPYIRGAYSFEFDGGQNETIDIILKPIEDKIYFSGESLSKDNVSTVHGAAESSYSVVETILKG